MVHSQLRKDVDELDRLRNRLEKLLTKRKPSLRAVKKIDRRMEFLVKRIERVERY